MTKKNIGSQSGWGDLPPKEREQAMQQIGRDFPSHYRDAIEAIFRRLAAEEKRARQATMNTILSGNPVDCPRRRRSRRQTLDGRTLTGPLVELRPSG